MAALEEKKWDSYCSAGDNCTIGSITHRATTKKCAETHARSQGAGGSPVIPPATPLNIPREITTAAPKACPAFTQVRVVRIL